MSVLEWSSDSHCWSLFMMTSHLKLIKLFGLGHNAEDVGFCSLRVEILIESLHTMKGEEIHVVNCFPSG